MVSHSDISTGATVRHVRNRPAPARMEFSPPAPRLIDTGDIVGISIDGDDRPEVTHDRRTGETVVRFSAPSDFVQPLITFQAGPDLRVTGIIERIDAERVRVNCVPSTVDRQSSVSRLFTPAVEERVELEVGARVIRHMGPL